MAIDVVKDSGECNVRLFGSDPNKPVPNINGSRWDDEAFCNINLPMFNAKGAKFTLENGIYVLEKSGVQVKIWDLNDQVIEFAVVFVSPPPTNEIRLAVTMSNGLIWLPQPIDPSTIDPFYDPAMDSAPDNVRGSLALYYNKGWNKYKTGKFLHFYRWSMTDNNGRQIWCDLNLDGNDIIVSCDGAWLQAAAYPVTLMGHGDSIGYMGEGANEGIRTTSSASLCHLQYLFTASGGETIAKYWCFGDDQASEAPTVGMTLYTGVTAQSSADGASRAFSETTVPITSAFPTNGWNSATPGSQTLSATTYACALGNESDGWQMNFDYDLSFNNADSNASGTTLPATWSEASTNIRRWSMYAETAAAGGGMIRHPGMNGGMRDMVGGMRG